MTIRHLYPAVEPSLNLDFANSKKLDSRITFTRASTGTYLDPETQLLTTAAANEARIEKEGLLIEESRTNLAENSEDFSLWTTQNSTLLTAQGTAPDGTNTAFKIQENTSTISHSIREPSNSSWSGVATLSCFVKPAGRNFAYMGFTGVSQTSITFDLVNKVSSYQGTNVTSGSVEDAGNGWLRIVAVFSSSITSGRATVGPAESDSSGGLNYTGDGSSGILAWGAQLEAGSFPTSYIPTSGSTVTRSADVASMTGTNFSSWYNQSEGTLFAQWVSPDTKQFSSPAIIKESTAKNGPRIYNYAYTGNKIYALVKTTVEHAILLTSVYSPSAPLKTIIGYSASEVASTFNGNSTQTASITTAIPTMTRLDIGDVYATNDRYSNHHIARLTYYPTRLPDATLQALTL
jgi:hypothetical protein